MKKPYLIIFFIAIMPGIALSQQTNPTKEELKKKYENSDIYKETDKKMQSGNTYPDSIVLAPLHFVSTYIIYDTVEFEFNSISFDVNVQTKIPDDYKFYISTFNGNINKMQLYGGIQTQSDGKPINGGEFIGIGRGGIFSRWMERNKSALKTDGYYASSDSEGDFISVRNQFKWDKGMYRVRLFKSGYIPGKPIPEKFTRQDLTFAWGDYEHSWVTMEVEDLKSHKKVTIGSLAFPGKKLMYSNTNSFFFEQYGAIINFAKEKPPTNNKVIAYKNLPVVKLAIGHMMVNGKQVKPFKVKTFYNATHHPEQSKIAMPIPLLAKATYNAKTGIIQYEIGSFQSWVTPKE
ncbi:MAG: hypothetical protein V4553_12345 [Bacteroidota bacterium]